MERCNPYWWNKQLKGKKALIIGVGGSPQQYIQQMIERLVPFIQFLGMEIIDRYFIRAEEPDAVSKNEKAIEDIKALVDKIKV